MSSNIIIILYITSIQYRVCKIYIVYVYIDYYMYIKCVYVYNVI